MKTEYIILKEAKLTNNCPECYSTEGMTLSFKQKMVKSKLFVNTKGDVKETIFCSKCENQIFPGQWTLDIERVYDYHKKTIDQKRGSLKFTKYFYLILLAILIVVIAIGTYIWQPDFLGV